MFSSKSSELREIEESIGQDRLRDMEQDAANRGREQYGAVEVKGGPQIPETATKRVC